jgi:hypothetical protein
MKASPQGSVLQEKVPPGGVSPEPARPPPEAGLTGAKPPQAALQQALSRAVKTELKPSPTEAALPKEDLPLKTVRPP